MHKQTPATHAHLQRAEWRWGWGFHWVCVEEYYFDSAVGLFSVFSFIVFLPAGSPPPPHTHWPGFPTTGPWEGGYRGTKKSLLSFGFCVKTFQSPQRNNNLEHKLLPVGVFCGRAL